MDEVICNNSTCGYSFGKYPIGMEPEGQRKACPHCGSYKRMVRKAPFGGSLKSLGTLEYGANPKDTISKRKRFAWGMTGWHFSKKLRRLVKKDDHYDKRGNRRYEHIVDPITNEVIHHQDHPLTEHKGHGSDKPK